MKIEIVNMILKGNYFFRSALADVVEFIIVKPLLVLVPWREKKYMEGDDEKIQRTQCLDLEIFWHRILHGAIKFGTSFTALVDGIKGTREIRGFLISCAPGTEFIGLRMGETLKSIELLGPRYEDNSRAWDMIWIIKRRRIGKFRVLDVKPEGESEMKVHCVWIDGKKAGRRFDLTTEQAFILNDNELVPQYVFGQSTLIHVFAVASIIWAFVKTFEVKSHISQFFWKAVDFFR